MDIKTHPSKRKTSIVTFDGFAEENFFTGALPQMSIVELVVRVQCIRQVMNYESPIHVTIRNKWLGVVLTNLTLHPERDGLVSPVNIEAYNSVCNSLLEHQFTTSS